METIGISCSKCNKQRDAIHVSKNLVECLRCTTLHHVDDESYSTYSVIPLHVIEQRAKEQALEDIHQAIHLELWLEEQSLIGIDWANCFDTNNIRVA